jgi:hypothetical protein
MLFLKVEHSVLDRCFFAPLRKAIRYSVNVILVSLHRDVNAVIELEYKRFKASFIYTVACVTVIRYIANIFCVN